MVQQGNTSTFSKRADINAALDMVEDALEALQNKVKQQEAVQHLIVATPKEETTDLNVKKTQEYRRRNRSYRGNHSQQRSVLINRPCSSQKKGTKRYNTKHDESSGKHRMAQDEDFNNDGGLQKTRRSAQKKASVLTSKGEEQQEQKQSICTDDDEVCCMISSHSRNRRKKGEEKKENAQGTGNIKNRSSKKNSTGATRKRAKLTANFAKPTLSSAMHQILLENEPKHPKSNIISNIPFIPSGNKTGGQHVGVMIQQAMGQIIREPPPVSLHHTLQSSESRVSQSTEVSLNHIQAALVNIGKATSAAALHR